jgi:hypothetical protein
MASEVKPIIRPILQALAHKMMHCVFELVGEEQKSGVLSNWCVFWGELLLYNFDNS